MLASQTIAHRYENFEGSRLERLVMICDANQGGACAIAYMLISGACLRFFIDEGVFFIDETSLADVLEEVDEASDELRILVEEPGFEIESMVFAKRELSLALQGETTLVFGEDARTSGLVLRRAP